MNNLEPGDQPKISVVTVYFNRAKEVRESIESILSQTLTDFEFLIIDDCSTDNTYAELEKYVDDPRVRLIRNEENMGFVRSAKKAIHNARGEYIAIHGSGDLSLERRLELQSKVLDRESDIVLVGCVIAHVSRRRRILSMQNYGKYVNRNDLLNFNKLSHGEVMYRKADYHLAGGYREEFKFAQDYDLWLRMTKFGHAHIVQKTLYYRTALEGGASFNPEKIVQQCMFAKLAKDVNTNHADDQTKLLHKVTASGVESVISITDPYVQRNMFSRFNFLLAKGQIDDASFFVHNATPMYKIYYKFVLAVRKVDFLAAPMLHVFKLKYK